MIWYFRKIGGPQYRPIYTIVLIMGTPKMVPLILGNPYFAMLALHMQEKVISGDRCDAEVHNTAAYFVQ